MCIRDSSDLVSQTAEIVIPETSAREKPHKRYAVSDQQNLVIGVVYAAGHHAHSENFVPAGTIRCGKFDLITS